MLKNRISFYDDLDIDINSLEYQIFIIVLKSIDIGIDCKFLLKELWEQLHVHLRYSQEFPIHSVLLQVVVEEKSGSDPWLAKMLHDCITTGTILTSLILYIHTFIIRVILVYVNPVSITLVLKSIFPSYILDKFKCNIYSFIDIMYM